MLLKRMYWLGTLGVISACAPIPSDSIGYKPSFFEQVLAKKSTTNPSPTPAPAPALSLQDASAQDASEVQSSKKESLKKDSFIKKDSVNRTDLSASSEDSSTNESEVEIISPRTTEQDSDQYLDTLAQQLSETASNKNISSDTEELNASRYTSKQGEQLISAEDNNQIESETIRPALLATIEIENAASEPQTEPNNLLFTINAPNVNIINLTGKQLTKLVQASTFNNDQLNKALSLQLDQAPMFQLKTNASPNKSYLSRLQSIGKKKPSPTAQAESALLLEAKLIINHTDDPLTIGTTLSLMAFENATGEAIAETRTYQIISTNENNLDGLVAEAVEELSAEINNHWSGR